MCPKKSSFLCLVLLFFIPISCNPEKTDFPTSDPHTYARPEEAIIKHLILDIQLDFEEEILFGTATYEIEKKEGIREIFLDTKNLSIEKIFISPDGENLEGSSFSLESPNEILGQALKIDLNEDSRFIHIQYASQKGAEALQFLPASLTTDKKAPFLLTQSQAILARTWVPTQDSPAIRFS